MRGGDAEGPQIPTLIFGTVNGVIGVIAALPPAEFEFMVKVQVALNQVPPPPLLPPHHLPHTPLHGYLALKKTAPP